MTVVFSSSSPVASVALFLDGRLLASGEDEAGHKASGTLLFLLDKCLRDCDRSLRDARLFVSDLGPGSFTGVKVCVTMAKTMAFAQRVLAGGVSAFDLVSAEKPVALPSRKGEFFLRFPGEAPTIVTSLPSEAVVGQNPVSANALSLIDLVQPVRPELLVPLYVAEPSISKPRDPKILGGPRA